MDHVSHFHVSATWSGRALASLHAPPPRCRYIRAREERGKEGEREGERESFPLVISLHGGRFLASLAPPLTVGRSVDPTSCTYVLALLARLPSQRICLTASQPASLDPTAAAAFLRPTDGHV